MTESRSRRGDEAEVLGQMHARIRLLTSSAPIFTRALSIQQEHFPNLLPSYSLLTTLSRNYGIGFQC